MKRKLVFATNNIHKTEEVAKILSPDYEVLNLKDINCLVDIPETGDSFTENATLKSTYVYENFGLDCFSDDSGLEVEALNNAPGIFSARYSGIKDDQINLELLLKNMEGQTNRKARFRTIISLIQNGKNHLFEGTIEGTIRTSPSGNKGFGYDPIFQPNGYEITFAEMEMTEKNNISHRALAMQQLISFLKQ
jgi:XTP/dITP diphosphohydrolase